MKARRKALRLTQREVAAEEWLFSLPKIAEAPAPFEQAAARVNPSFG